MSGGKFATNLLTSVIFGPFKYGTKILIEPETRGKNTVFLLTSLFGAGILGDVIEAAAETGNGLTESISTLPLMPDLITEETSLEDEVLSNFLSEGIIPTINQDLVDTYHPETGVLFSMNEAYDSDLGEISGVFPVFDSVAEIELTKSEFLLSDYEQFSIGNKILLDNLESDQVTLEELGLTNDDYHFLSNGETPPGYVWHHHEEAGILQLVDEEIHRNTAHTGGRELWGGGEQFR